MSKCICTLEPKAIWENFYKLTQVPRPSNHEEKAREFVMNWAKENGIHAEMDEANNILLSKPAKMCIRDRTYSVSIPLITDSCLHWLQKPWKIA